jgi:hypothetical protein
MWFSSYASPGFLKEEAMKRLINDKRIREKNNASCYLKINAGVCQQTYRCYRFVEQAKIDMLLQ